MPNPLGGVHGGFAAPVLDSVAGCAVHTMLGAGVGYGTVDLHVTMVRQAPRDTDLVATGRVIDLSRNLGVSEGRLETADGKLLAHATHQHDPARLKRAPFRRLPAANAPAHAHPHSEGSITGLIGHGSRESRPPPCSLNFPIEQIETIHFCSRYSQLQTRQHRGLQT